MHGENTRHIYDRREARGLDDIFLAKQQHEKETQDLEGEMEAVHRRVSEPAFKCFYMFCPLSDRRDPTKRIDAIIVDRI